MATPALIEEKTCSKCSLTKPLNQFSKRKVSADGYRGQCKECCNVARNTDKHREVKNKRRRTRYAEDELYRLNSKIHQQNEVYKQWSKAYHSEYYLANKEELNETNKERSKQHYLDNIDSYKERHKIWRANNMDKTRHYASEYRSKKLQATATWDKELTDLCDEEAHAYAIFLEKLTGVKHEVDHIIPLQGKNVSGLHVWNNLQVITLSENRKKSSNLLKGL